MQLRDYQIEISTKACELLQAYKIAYLAMKPRTGKTLTALETALKYGALKVLFVTKKKAIKSIESDCIHYPTLQVTVINYESVLKCKGEYDLIIVDEAHSIGAFPKPAKRVKDLMQITKNKPIIYLSGTPTPESHSQIYHQFFISSFTPFLKYRTFYKFADEYVNKKTKIINSFTINDYSYAKIDKIEPIISRYFLTQTQEQAGFCNTIKENILTVDMCAGQKMAIDKLIKDRVLRTKGGFDILADTAVKLQSKIHQICSGSVKTETGEILTITDNKAQYIKEYFKGKKIAVFYKFIGELQILKDVFSDRWTDSPEMFQLSDDLIYLGQFVSSREGVRLDTADAIIFYNIDFSYLSYDQAKERIVSKERTKEALLYWVFTNEGIEEKIYKVVKNKKDFTNYYFKKEYGIENTKKAD